MSCNPYRSPEEIVQAELVPDRNSSRQFPVAWALVALLVTNVLGRELGGLWLAAFPITCMVVLLALVAYEIFRRITSCR